MIYDKIKVILIKGETIKMNYQNFKQKMDSEYGLVTELAFNGDIYLTGQIQDGLGGEMPILIYSSKLHKIITGNKNDMLDTAYTQQNIDEIKPIFQKFINTSREQKEYPKWFLFFHKLLNTKSAKD